MEWDYRGECGECDWVVEGKEVEALVKGGAGFCLVDVGYVQRSVDSCISFVVFMGKNEKMGEEMVKENEDLGP